MRTEHKIINITDIDFDTLGVPLVPKLLTSIQDLHQKGIFAGLLHSLVLIKYEDVNKYKMGAGRRRLRVLNELGIEQVPANVIFAGKIDQAAKDEIEAIVTLIENQARKDNPVSDVLAIQKLTWFHLSPKEIREKTGLDKRTYDSLSSLLLLIDDLFQAFCHRKIVLGVAKRLAKIDPNGQRDLLRIYRENEDKLTHKHLDQWQATGQSAHTLPDALFGEVPQVSPERQNYEAAKGLILQGLDMLSPEEKQSILSQLINAQ
ncbi:MAG: hypothetical protein AAGA60_10885 [Cyanobacteria bacterium P01_E01_bin.42]